MKFGLTVLRGVIGALFFGHGAQKLFGWFGGHGPEGTGQFFESIGLRPGRRHATAAGATEAGAGTLLALGLFTPASAASLIGVMSTAIRKVHGKNGPWSSDGGYEFNLVLIAALLALADLGPGDLSLDRALGIELKGPVVALLALAGGVGGGELLTRFGSQPAEEIESAEDTTVAPEPAGAVPEPAPTELEGATA